MCTYVCLQLDEAQASFLSQRQEMTERFCEVHSCIEQLDGLLLGSQQEVAQWRSSYEALQQEFEDYKASGAAAVGSSAEFRTPVPTRSAGGETLPEGEWGRRPGSGAALQQGAALTPRSPEIPLLSAKAMYKVSEMLHVQAT